MHRKRDKIHVAWLDRKNHWLIWVCPICGFSAADQSQPKIERLFGCGCNAPKVKIWVERTNED